MCWIARLNCGEILKCVSKLCNICVYEAIHICTVFCHNKSFQYYSFCSRVYWMSYIQCRPVNSDSVNSKILLIQTGDYGPCRAHCINTLFQANSYLEHFIIKTRFVGLREFELGGLHYIYMHQVIIWPATECFFLQKKFTNV